MSIAFLFILTWLLVGLTFSDALIFIRVVYDIFDTLRYHMLLGKIIWGYSDGFGTFLTWNREIYRVERADVVHICHWMVSNLGKSCGDQWGTPNRPKLFDGTVMAVKPLVSFFTYLLTNSLSSPNPPNQKDISGLEIHETLNLTRNWR